MDTVFAFNLDGGLPAAGGLKQYEPGSLLQGTVVITPGDNINCRSVELWVEWHSEGRGDRDRGVIGQVRIHEGSVQAGIPITGGFSVTLPVMPWSYSGHFLHLVWEVRAKIDIAMKSDIEGMQRFIVYPMAAMPEGTIKASVEEADPFDYDPFSKNDEVFR